MNKLRIFRMTMNRESFEKVEEDLAFFHNTKVILPFFSLVTRQMIGFHETHGIKVEFFD